MSKPEAVEQPLKRALFHAFERMLDESLAAVQIEDVLIVLNGDGYQSVIESDEIQCYLRYSPIETETRNDKLYPVLQGKQRDMISLFGFKVVISDMGLIDLNNQFSKPPKCLMVLCGGIMDREFLFNYFYEIELPNSETPNTIELWWDSDSEMYYHDSETMRNWYKLVSKDSEGFTLEWVMSEPYPATEMRGR